jgi:filamentous hemagglutinin family protein
VNKKSFLFISWRFKMAFYKDRLFLQFGFKSLLSLGGIILPFWLLNNGMVLAQIVPDNTLGSENSMVIPNSNVGGLPADLIEGGATRGGNLFHSFQEFNVEELQRVFFANPTGIENILSRVTGGNRSDILGTLGVDGTANLFFINPNGILFGSNAQLDVRGSFVATTANALQFEGQGFFSASEPEVPALLTVNPSAFLVNQISGASIENRSIAPTGLDSLGNQLFGLRVPDGQSLVLVGGDVNLIGGSLNAPGGRVELGGLAEAGTVDIVDTGGARQLVFPDGVERSDVSVTDGAVVNVVTPTDGGDIQINASNLTLATGGVLQAGGITNNAGDILIDVSDTLAISGEFGQPSGIINGALPGTSPVDVAGNAGDVEIMTGSLIGRGQFVIGSGTFSSGDAGNVSITADNEISLDGESPSGKIVFASGIASATNAQGDAAEVIITAQSLSMSNGTQLVSSTRGSGNAGNITLNILGNSFNLESGSIIQARSFGQGNAGNIIVNAPNASVSIDGTLVTDDFFGLYFARSKLAFSV